MSFIKKSFAVIFIMTVLAIGIFTTNKNTTNRGHRKERSIYSDPNKVEYITIRGKEEIEILNHIFKFNNLSSLSIYDIDSLVLPENIKKLTNLSYIYLNNINNKIIPKQIFDLENIETLHVVSSKIEIIPTEICNHPTLSRLKIYNCNLSELPEFLFDSLDLYSLEVASNKIKHIPKSIINERSNLSIVNFNNNEIDELPIEIFLVQVFGLNLRGLGISDLPDLSSGNYKQYQLLLEEEEIPIYSSYAIDLSNNNLSSLSSNFHKLDPKVLRLNGNNFKKFPEEVLNMSNIENLDISKNELTDLPQSITKLKLLKEINVTGNNISKDRIEFLDSVMVNCTFIKD